MSPLSNKERMQIQRHEMPAQEPEVRAGNFEEVALGYTWEDALAEAERCLQCAKPHCVDGLPGWRADSAVHQGAARGRSARRGRGDEGEEQPARHLRPRVPAGIAVRGDTASWARRAQSVAIGRLERYVGDYALREQLKPEPPAPATGRKVAVVGSGPAGLTCAVDLAKLGHKVTIFESLHVPGGVLVYGIPEFRLPKSIIRAEIRDRGRLPGHRDAHRPRHRQHLHAGRAAERIRRDLHGHGRGPAELHAHPRHQPERRDVGQRIPDPRQPDEGLPLPRVRHAGEDGPQGGRDRRGQRGDGLGAQQPPSADACSGSASRLWSATGTQITARCTSSTAARATRCPPARKSSTMPWRKA